MRSMQWQLGISGTISAFAYRYRETKEKPVPRWPVAGPSNLGENQVANYNGRIVYTSRVCRNQFYGLCHRKWTVILDVECQVYLEVKLARTIEEKQRSVSQFQRHDSWSDGTRGVPNKPKVNPLNPELNHICYLLALLGAHHFLHVSRIRVKLLTFRRLMLYIYIYMEHPFLMFLDHTQ